MKKFTSRLKQWYLLLAVGLLPFALKAQGWEKLYGGPDAEAGYAVQETYDLGYVVAGWTESFGSGEEDFLVFHVDSSGNQLWLKAYGTQHEERAYDIIQTPDSGFAIVGHTDDGVNGADIYLVRIDKNGGLLWDQNYGGAYDDFAYSILLDDSNGFVIAGVSYDSTGQSDFYLLRTDSDGVLSWEYTYGTPGMDIANSLYATLDSGYIVAGFSDTLGSSGKDLYLIKTNATGDSLWASHYGQSGDEYGHSVIAVADSGFVVTGYVHNYDARRTDVLLTKFDKNGALVWEELYGDVGDDQGYEVVANADGGFTISGFTTSFGNTAGDVYLIRTNANGIEQWSNTFGGSIGDKGLSIDHTVQGGYIIAGYKWGFNTFDCYLLKTDSLGNTCSAVSCVLPGDANQDGVANNYDILNLGLAHNSTGQVRPDSTLIWIPQHATDWQDAIPNGLDKKHMDCNGDGKVDIQDTTAIQLNYGRNFSFKTDDGGFRACNGTMLPLYFEFPSDSVEFGDTIEVKISLGDATFPATNVYGMAFTIQYDRELLDTGLIDLDFNTNWFGTPADRMQLHRHFESIGRTDVGLVKHNQAPSSGQGSVISFHIVIEDNLEGKDMHPYELFKLDFSNVLVIDENGDPIPVCLEADTLVITELTHVPPPPRRVDQLVKTFPNPSNQFINITASQTEITGYHLTNVLGQLVATQQDLAIRHHQISTGQLPDGVYYLTIQTTAGSITRKITVHH